MTAIQLALDYNLNITHIISVTIVIEIVIL